MQLSYLSFCFFCVVVICYLDPEFFCKLRLDLVVNATQNVVAKRGTKKREIEQTKWNTKETDFKKEATKN